MSQVHSLNPVRRLSEAEEHILNAIGQIRYGSVEVVIHDSRIVQIEKSEKVRFETKRDA
ncbi:YezD family protein [Asticcacaulis sp. BYS171W]|uniref:YezD family protein n=1 Tax=Asticcacaulis aquaticus TaxID=2984212 RepID=A0ABT5HTZ6_9CAUL|nr:YezD family protein [Asticcacaulis aquaticus]MDC7683392.1 YezD family protein [Asticcacaulis aquaticus]